MGARRQDGAGIHCRSARGSRVCASSLTTQADAEDLYEEEFHDLLHFATLEEAEMCLVRLDELWRKFRAEGERAAVERVAGGRATGAAARGDDRAQPARRGQKREEKQEIMEWFRIWLKTPEAFFDWLEVRKQSAGLPAAIRRASPRSGGIAPIAEDAAPPRSRSARSGHGRARRSARTDRIRRVGSR